jgi:hypothetical protein
MEAPMARIELDVQTTEISESDINDVREALTRIAAQFTEDMTLRFAIHPDKLLMLVLETEKQNALALRLDSDVVFRFLVNTCIDFGNKILRKK